MRYDVAVVMKGLMDKASALVDESVEVDKISLEDSDLEGLRKKAGDRVITMSVVCLKDMLKASIEKDLKEIESQLATFVCDSVEHTRRSIWVACNKMVLYMLEKHSLAGVWHDLSKEQQTACLAEMDKVVDSAMANITGIRQKED